MAANPRTAPLTLPVAAIGAAFAGALVAAGIAASPAATLGALIDAAGLPDLVAAAAPPIGVTGRVTLAIAAGAVMAAVVWAVIVLTVGTHWTRRAGAGSMPVLRRADVHPDAPARRPIRASEELGPPLPAIDPVIAAAPAPLPQPAAQALPRNLDVPLAYYDPGAIPAVPAEPVRAIAARPRPERLETFELTPLRRDMPVPEDRPSLTALIDRLEAKTNGRPVRPSGHSVADTIGVLRRLAAQ
ncbi:conserved hypothetical protein [Sphingomonas sp. EC-HK361]|uniref:hypothetical protein n=1 Tax=Sphingomonas sp. EC-HK361 TaxID=2038397 RepID=UPI0012581128|nr:hypothetical protein [Sphingomonas sp. EC-HK361]VVT23604.1 conserved hypothetical protein [Sphingomonas sp. EC-HK361]